MPSHRRQARASLRAERDAEDVPARRPDEQHLPRRRHAPELGRVPSFRRRRVHRRDAVPRRRLVHSTRLVAPRQSRHRLVQHFVLVGLTLHRSTASA